jgi:hypothetical protein
MKKRVLAAILLSAAACGLASTGALAANPHDPDGSMGAGRQCATVEPTLGEISGVSKAIEVYRRENPFAQLAVGGQIKVAFHVIYSGNQGNVPQSQIDAQIAELNRAYSGGHGGVNTGYTFVLASVSRTSNKKWFTMTPGTGPENQAKQALATDVAHRLNIYTCKPGQNLLGWAVFPNSYPENDYHHGVVIHYGSLPGGYLSPYNLGGTADHEVGHYLGLYHTFQGGCSAPGDAVDDTPYEATATAGCPNGKDTCPGSGLDPIHNYMDYSDDACYTQFTSGQDARMDGIVPVYRPSLLNASLAALSGASASELALAPSASAAGQFAFRGAFPNPFSSETVLHFALPKSGEASLKLYNVAGQHVATLVDGMLGAGEQTATLRAGRLPPGMYFAALRYDGQVVTRSVMLVP